MAKQGLHRLISQANQTITGLVSNNVRAASAISRTAVSRVGYGTINLTGPLTGNADKAVDVEISSGIDTKRTTVPVFSGIGSGSLSEQDAASGTSVQKITIQCIDAGKPGAKAEIDLGGAQLVAKATGTAGNAITLTVDQSGLTIAPTNYSLVAAVELGMETSQDNGLDFGGPLGTPTKVPADALRIKIGGDQGQIYTYWKSFTAGVASFHFAPKLRRRYEAGEPIYFVTGSRTATLTDGITPEAYSGIVSLADLLTAVKASSALVDVEGTINPARDNNNLQGIADLAIWTTARVDDTGGTGSSYALQGPSDVSVGDAATEIVEATCLANTTDQGAGPGNEVWSVKGSVSGALGTAKSGEQVQGPAGRWRMTIPQHLPTDYDKSHTAPIWARVVIADANSNAAVAVDPLRAGHLATTKQITFTYRQRPVATCDPLQTQYMKRKGIERLLGFSFITKREALRVSLAADYQTRLEALYTWRASFLGANARSEVWSPDSRYRLFRVAELDMDLCDSVTSVLAKAIQQVYSNPAGRADWDAAFNEAQTELAPFSTSAIEQIYSVASEWDDNKSYGPGEFVKTDLRPGWVFVSQQAGTSGAAEPQDQPGPTATTWATNTYYNVGDLVVPTTRNGIAYKCTTAGTSDPSTEPTWPTIIGNTVTDGPDTLEWTAEEKYWEKSKLYFVGDIIRPHEGNLYVCTLQGISDGVTEPTWTGQPGPITDHQTEWHLIGTWGNTVGATTVDGSVIWEAYQQYWQPSTSYAIDDVMIPWNGLKYVCSQQGTSGTSEPNWTYSSAAITDGGAKWERSTVTGSGSAEAIEEANVEYIHNTWEWKTAAKSTQFEPPVTLQGVVTGQSGLGYETNTVQYPPAKITTVDTTQYVYSRVWRVVDNTTTLVYSRSWQTNSLDSAEVTNLLEAAREEVENYLQTLRNELAGMSKVEDYVRKWKARADQVLATGGVEPSFNAAGSSTMDGGSEIWRDVGDAYWWIPEDADYLPAFSNVEYVSCRKDNVGNIVSTAEFSFAIRVGSCAVVADGDTVTINVGTALWGSTYQVGDTLFLSTVAGQPLACAGGVDADEVQTWSVNAEVDGPLPAYSLNPASPALYANGGVQFRLNPGGIPFGVGDIWEFGIEAGSFRWREDGSSWSPAMGIADTAIGDGLLIGFADGIAPSFVAGDSASFLAEQSYAADHVLSPDDELHAWPGAEVILTATCAGTVDAVVIGRHTLCEGATVEVHDEGFLSETIPWSRGPMVLLLDTPLTDPTLTITITCAQDGTVSWIWAGEAKQTDLPADRITRKIRHEMIRGDGLNPSAVRLGRGGGYDLQFDGWLTAQDLADLEAALEAAKAAGDLPAVFVPHEDLPGEAVLVRLPDELDVEDRFGFEDSTTANRKHFVSLELTPWLMP